jgi:transcriptional regulator with XRE-family HTH domain
MAIRNSWPPVQDIAGYDVFEPSFGLLPAVQPLIDVRAYAFRSAFGLLNGAGPNRKLNAPATSGAVVVVTSGDLGPTLRPPPCDGHRRLHRETAQHGMGCHEITLRTPDPIGGARPCIGIDVNGIGQRIREARSKRGWSQNELASRAGVKQPTLQRIEAGLRQDPSIRTIAALAVALGMTIDALVDQAAPLTTPQSDASQIAFDAIEELTRHVAEVEERLDARLRDLEDAQAKKAALRAAT